MHREEGSFVLLCRGIGYQVFCSASTLDEFSDSGGALQVWIYQHQTDNGSTLYGFKDLTEKKLFLNLIKVNGVGPKLAIGAMSGAPLQRIISWIDSKDVKGLTQLPKIGKKTAEQMILTLKGQLVLQDSNSESQIPLGSSRQEVLSALVHLGFSHSLVEEVVEKLPQDVDFELGVRKSLLELSAQP